jgi:hypothetical protein
MNPMRCAVVTCVALSISIVSAASASALPANDPGSDGTRVTAQVSTARAQGEIAAAPVCGRTQFCVWASANYTGDKHGIPDRGTGICWVGIPTRSFINNSNVEGYFYANGNCSGRARAVTGHTRSADIGYTAQSFLTACVSC